MKVAKNHKEPATQALPARGHGSSVASSRQADTFERTGFFMRNAVRQAGAMVDEYRQGMPAVAPGSVIAVLGSSIYDEKSRFASGPLPLEVNILKAQDGAKVSLKKGQPLILEVIANSPWIKGWEVNSNIRSAPHVSSFTFFPDVSGGGDESFVRYTWDANDLQRAGREFRITARCITPRSPVKTHILDVLLTD